MKNTLLLALLLNYSVAAVHAQKYVTETEQLNAILEDVLNIKLMDKPSEKVQMAVIDALSSARGFKYIKSPTYSVVKRALKESPQNIQYIENPSKELQVIAASNLWQYTSVEHFWLNDSDESVQRIAVKRKPSIIEFIKQPSVEVQSIAIKEAENKCYIFKLIENPVQESIKLAVPECPELITQVDNPSEQLQLSILNTANGYGENIQYIKNPSIKVIWAALEQSSSAIGYIEKPTQEMKEYVVKKVPASVIDIKNASDDLYILALDTIEYNLYSLYKKFKKPSKKVTMYALSRDASCFEYIKNPTEEMIKKAVSDKPSMIQYVEKQSEELQLLAIENQAKDSFFYLRHLKTLSDKVMVTWIDKVSAYDIGKIETPSKELQMYAAKRAVNALGYLKHIDPEVAEYIFKSDDVNFFHYPQLDENSQLIALIYHPEAFKSFKNTSEKVKKFAIQQDANNVLVIENPDVELLTLAIEKDFKIIQKIKKQTEELQILAMKQDIEAFNYISKFEGDAKKYFLKASGLFLEDGKSADFETQINVIKKLPWAIEFVKNPSESLQLAAVKLQGNTLQFFTNSSEKVKNTAIKTNGWAIKYIKKPTEAMKELAIKKQPNTLKYIKNASEYLQLLAVSNDCRSIGYLKNPSPKVQFIAMRENVRCVEGIAVPDEDVIEKILESDGSVVVFMRNATSRLKALGKEKKVEEREKRLEKNGLAIKRMYGDISDDLKSIAIHQNPKSILYIVEPDKSLLALAIKVAGGSKDFIYKPNDKVYLETSKKIPWSIYLVDNPSDEILKKAFKDNVEIVGVMPNASEEMLLEALERNSTIIPDISYALYKKYASVKFKAIGFNAKLMKNIIEALPKNEQKRAIDANTSSILYMKNRDEAIIKYALAKDGDLLNKVYPLTSNSNKNFFELISSPDIWKNIIDEQNIPKKVLLTALAEKGITTEFLDNPTEENQLKALEKAPWVLRFISHTTEKVKRKAIELEPLMIVFIHKPSEALKILAIKKSLGVVPFISNIPESLNSYIVKKDASYIKEIAYPSKELQFIAVREDPENLQYIPLPDKEVSDYAISKDSDVEKYVFESSDIWSKVSRWFK